MSARTPESVSAVVCTLNSISGIERCLNSLKAAGVAEIIVVDAGSDDGTREIADRIADQVLEDRGLGLGNARNVGIAASHGALILNMGSDNVMPPGQLQVMIDDLTELQVQGVSAQTRILGTDLVSRGLDAWRQGRFHPGFADVIGTPTLFDGELLRAHPYDSSRRFSDDSELCERWTEEFEARFAISRAYVEEIGKTTWPELLIRCRMYGISDHEVFREGKSQGWSLARQAQSTLHPLKVDLVEPLSRLPIDRAVTAAPFLTVFTTLRYGYWAQTALRAALKR